MVFFFFLISGWWGKVKLSVGGTIPILCVSGLIIKHEKWTISMKPVSSTLPWAPSQLPLLGSCPIRVSVLTLFSYITWCTSKRKISIFLLKLVLVLVVYHGNSNQKRGINTFYISQSPKLLFEPSWIISGVSHYQSSSVEI